MSLKRFTSLVLAILMLVTATVLPVYAEDGEQEGKVFASVDFETVTAIGSTIDPASAGMTGAHPYVSIAEDEEHGKYVIVPFRGLSEDGKTGTGNFDKTFTVQHPEVSYEDTQGVSIELDIKPGYLKIEGASDPTLEFQLKSAKHDPDLGGKTSTNFISFGWINMRTGEFTTSATRLGAKGLVHGEWNKVRFDLDLVNGTFDIYVNGAWYATYGTLGKNNSPKNLIIPSSSLLIAKSNKNKGAYVDDESVADTDMTYAAIDNVKFFENVDFVPPASEPSIPYAIFNDSLQSKPLGMNPKYFGYSTAPNTSVVTNDPLDSSNQVVKVEFKGQGDEEYYLLSSSLQGSEVIKANADYDPKDPENHPKYTIVDGVMTATTSKGGVITAPIWGDDENEKSGKPGAAYEITSMADVLDNKGKTCKWYIVTGAYCDAQNGAGNVCTGLQPKHPGIPSSEYDTVVLNVDYYFSADACGKVEIQMQSRFALKSDNNVRSDKIWIDVAVLEARRDNDVIQFSNTSNYVYVCGSAPTVRKGEWFTLSAVIDMHTGYEDIYINGSYCFTQKPKATYKIGGADVSEADYEFYTIETNSLSVGKIQRNTLPENLSGFYMIDNINFSTGEVLLGEQYEKNFVQNFDDIAPDTVDFSETLFGNNIPASVVLASEGTHTSALKLPVGEPVDEALASALVLFRTDKNADKTMYRVVSINEENSSAVLENGEIAKCNVYGKYTVGDVRGYVLATYKDYVNFWATHESGMPAENLDKQWTFHNPGISYATKTRVATDVEIFLPAGASGLVTAQISKGAGTDANGAKANFTCLDLYHIDLADGRVVIGDSENVDLDGAASGQMKIGEWNTVSLAINMVSGIAELYINNVYAGEASLGYTSLAFYENTWTLAKVEKRQDPQKHPLAGYLLIDDARFFTVTNQLVTVDSALENVTEVIFNGESVADGTKLFITEDVSYETVRFDIAGFEDVVSKGYSDDYMVGVRSNAPIGLRFTSYVDTELLEELLEKYDGTVTFGTVIVPSSAVATMEKITRPELELRGIEYLEIRTDEFYSDEYLEEEYGFDFEGIFAGSIVGLKEANLKRDFSAVGYVEIALEGGGSVVIYTEEMKANLATHAQNYLDELDDIPEQIRKVLDGFAIGRYPVGYVKDYPDIAE